jgi:tetratricopeptide (TPR) repeat protein
MNIRKLAAILVLSAAGLWGQGTTQMTGTVIGPDGKPVQGAEVSINRTDIKANYKIKTDKNGKFNYATLPKGTFDVTVTVNGEKVYDARGMQTDYAKPTTVDVNMAKQAAAQQQPQQQQQPALQARQAAAPPPSLPVHRGELPPGGVAVTGGKESAPPQQTATNQPPPQAAPEPGLSPEEQAARLAALEKQRKEYEEAQSKDKGLQDAFNQGMEAAKAKNYPAAIDAFKKAAEFGPKQHAVWGQMADAYDKKAGTEKGAERLADYKASADAYLKAIEIAPEDPTYRYNASLMLARSNDMDKAQEQLAKAVQLDPTNGARGYRNLGAVYFDTNRSEAAQAAYKKAIELDPKDANSHYQLAISLMQQATETNGKLNVPPGTEDELQAYMELAPTGPYAEEVKSMLQALGATVTNRVTRPGATPTKPAPAKAKGKQ